MFQTIVFPPLQRCRHDAILRKWTDWLWLCLGLMGCEQEAAINELFEAPGWDYVHEISHPFLNFDDIFFCRQSFVQPFFATDNTTVVSVQPETERQGDSCANAINVTASVDVGHSGQGNKASKQDGDRRECVFCSSCVTCVRQQCLGHKRNFGLWWTCVEHGWILYMFVKRRLWCV